MSLIIFAALIYAGWHVFPPANINGKLFAKTNAVTFLIWGLWWPVIIITTIFSGRLWCMICPMELVSKYSEKFGRFSGIKQFNIPKWIRNGVIILLFYFIIQMLIPGVKLHRNPAYTSFFLITLLLLALLTGIIFKNRAFCRGFCPVGLLLNAYGRGGMFGVRKVSENVCTSCTDKTCKKDCRSLLNPETLNSSKDCLVCTQCIKSCGHNNIEIKKKSFFSFADDRELKSGWVFTLFTMMLSGFVTSELTTEWKYANEIFLAVPHYITSVTGLKPAAGFIEGVWTIIFFPLILWTFTGLSSLITGGAESLTDAWRKSAVPFIIIISAGHMVKAAAKLNSWLPYGFKTISETAKPMQLFDSSVISIAGTALLLIALVYSIREDRHIHREDTFKKLFPKLILFALYTAIVVGI